MHQKYHLSSRINYISRSSLSRNIRIAADSTMFLIVNLLIALSFGVQREQLLHLTGLTWPLPFLFRPLHTSLVYGRGIRRGSTDLDARFLTMMGDSSCDDFRTINRSLQVRVYRQSSVLGNAGAFRRSDAQILAFIVRRSAADSCLNIV